MRWIHLNINFGNYEEISRTFLNDAFPQRKPEGNYKEIICYLKRVVDSLSPDLINRYFFLFEPNPHLFLALEVRDIRNEDLVKDKITLVSKL